LEQYYDTYIIDSLCLNPLYYATECVDHILAGLPDGRTNATQMVPYYAYSDHPFVVLQIKPAHATHVVVIDMADL